MLGTRGSSLALVQTALVRDALTARHPRLSFPERTITTRGDVRRDVPLAEIGGQGVFVTEIERALGAGDVDIAVHSAKDLPSQLGHGLTIAATLERADPRDVLLSRAGPLRELPLRARVGTSSPRRAFQLRALRPDLTLLDLRGNVDTRIAKLDRGEYDAIVLAAAGVVRLGLAHRVTEWLSPDIVIPMVAQGVIALEVRASDDDAHAVAASVDHAGTRVAVTAERAFLARLGAGCTAPLAAHATVDGDRVTLTAMLGASDGRQARVQDTASAADAESLGIALAERCLSESAFAPRPVA